VIKDLSQNLLKNIKIQANFSDNYRLFKHLFNNQPISRFYIIHQLQNQKKNLHPSKSCEEIKTAIDYNCLKYFKY